MENISSNHALPTRRQSFSVVLAIEFWERFGFYGMQAVLLLYLVQKLAIPDVHATLLIGAFSALTYIFPVIGGVVGDRLLGARRCMVFGASLLTLGYLFLALVGDHRSLLPVALSFIAVGNGLFKPNVGNIVRKIYEGQNAELDAAFTIYYMSVNVGSSISMLLTPVLQDKYGPASAFFVCACGLALGLLYYVWRSRWLTQRETPEERQPLKGALWGAVSAGLVVCLGIGIAVLENESIARFLIGIAGGLILIAWLWLYRRVNVVERIGLRIAYLLCTETMVYALFYQQQLTSLTLFALRGVDGDFRIGGHLLFHMSAGQFQALDPIWIMLISPLLAAVYGVLGKRGKDLTLATKIAVGFGLGSAGFAVWWFFAARATGLVSPWTVVLGYGFSSAGELLTMALGLAIIARYAPARYSGFMMGSLYLLWALAFYLGSVLSNVYAVPNDAEAHRAVAYAPLLHDLTVSISCMFVCAVIVAWLIRGADRRFSQGA